jgi:hypothetical protein
LYLSLAGAYKFISTFGVNSRGLKTNVCEIIQVNTTGPTAFYCPECKEDVPLENAVVQCQMCGDFFELGNCYRSTKSGGMYCEAHAREFFPGEIERLNVRTFNIQKGRS